MTIEEIRETVLEGAPLHDVVCKMLRLKHRVNGAYLHILCPHPDHHDRRMGNCVVYANRGHCYACGEGFNAIDLVMMTHDCSFFEAVHELADFFNLTIDFSVSDPIEPLKIPKELLDACGIDKAQFKKLVTSNLQAAFRLLTIAIPSATRKYSAGLQVESCEEVNAILKDRIALLNDANKNLNTWLAEAQTKPIRIV